MQPARRTWVVFAAPTLLIAVAGCSSSSLPDTPSERIAAAKAAAQSAEDTVADFVPRDEVERRHQIPTGNLLPCSSGKQWSGNTTMQLVRRYDADGLVDTVARKAARAGFTVERDVSRSGTPRLSVTNNAGVSLLFGVWNHGTVVNIDSFSMCFSLPTGFSPHPSY
jgi:hypothetical protein